ncbi:MAG: PASTA domain-containing protein [Acidimicrobiales bacterium]
MRLRSALLMTVVGLLGLAPVLYAHPVAGAGVSHAPVRMPNVIHFDQATSDAAMARAGLYFRVNGPTGWNDVVAENPRPGTLVPWHSTVVLATTVSSAPQSGTTVMPDVLYRTRSEVFAAMAHAGLYFTTRGPANWTIVVAQDPRPGSTIAVHSSVVVVTARVATTSPSGTTVMPDVTHRARGAAFTAMAKAGLYFTVSGPANWNIVTGQRPAPGTHVAWHSSVALTVARETAPTTTTTVRARARPRVPSLVGRTRATVIALLSRAGLRLHPQGPGSTDGTWTKAVAQSPSPGTVVRRGSVVVVDTMRTPPPGTTTTRVTTTTTSPGGSTTSTTATTTTRPTLTTIVRAAPTRTRIGVATWYAYIPGQCATWYLPRGTRITVEDLSTGRTIACVVTDRQDYSPGRVVDLSRTQFAELTPLWRGVVRVKVSW